MHHYLKGVDHEIIWTVTQTGYGSTTNMIISYSMTCSLGAAKRNQGFLHA